ncbi:MAG: hypothetical protein Q4G58_10480, partial [bacterium]|nr:hypothetical protein [bacterium]
PKGCHIFDVSNVLPGVADTDFAYLVHEHRFEIPIRKPATVKLIAAGVLGEKELFRLREEQLIDTMTSIVLMLNYF